VFIYIIKMVNQVVLEYLRTNRGNYKIEDLKKKVLASGYSQKDIDEVMVQLNRQSQGNAPSVPATINKINKTNINLNANKPVAQKNVNANVSKPKKKKKWLKWFIIVWIIILILVGIGFGVWWWLSNKGV